jgi:hypothetical protein
MHKNIELIVPEQYSTVSTSIQKAPPLCSDWLQHRSHRSWLKKQQCSFFVERECSDFDFKIEPLASK